MRRQPIPWTLGLLTFLVGLGPLGAQRQRYAMDAGWRFTIGDPAGAERPGFADAAWRRVDLPHDWSIEGVPTAQAPGGGTVGYFPTGTGWYRKHFRLPPATRGREVTLRFDGVYMLSDVWINGVHLGQRPFGYIGFAYDLTPHLRDGENVVAVRVDNSRQPNSRWYTGSGIYRHTWLEVTAPVRVAQDGIVVRTLDADSGGASLAVTATIKNTGDRPRDTEFRAIVLDPDGAVAASEAARITLPADGRDSVGVRIAIRAPRRWSPEAPERYRLRTEVRVAGRVVDTTLTLIGIRTIAWAADSGFALNGQRIKLRGVNLHHEAGAMGAAVPTSVWRDRLLTLRAMGVNAIRTAHNPPTPEFLDLCDELGLLVMAEAFDEWTFGKVAEGYHRYFAEWGHRDLVDFIRRDRNHPSIVLWSVGNEIGEQGAPGGADVLRGLMAVVHREDPTRPVTTGNDHIMSDDNPATPAFLAALDIVGYNYVDRWHERREVYAEADRVAHPDRPMLGTESVAAQGPRTGRPSLGDDPSRVEPDYATGMLRAERLWRWVAMHDYFAGDFMWTGIDYLGETRWPGKGAGSGAIDITGEPKDAYYLYQSLWTAASMLHIVPHWTWPGREGQVVPVLVYTNCNAVELFLNGRSLGEKRMEFPPQGTTGSWNGYALPQVDATTSDLHLAWDVPYAPGVLRAVGRDRFGTIRCEATARTAGPPAAIRLRADRDTAGTAFDDAVIVRFAIVDRQGTIVPGADSLIHVTVTGGTLLAMDNADLQDHDRYQVDHRRAFAGRGIAILRGSGAGALTVRAEVAGLPPAELTVPVAASPVRPLVPGLR